MFLQHPWFDTRADQLGRPRHAQAGDRGLRAAAAVARRVWWGLAAGQLAARAARAAGSPARLAARAAPLAALGRWRLSFYMLHQPVLIGLLIA